MATFYGIGNFIPRLVGGTIRHRDATPQFTAVLDALLDIRPRRTALDFEEFACVDGLLYARSSGDADFRHYVGPRIDLIDSVEWMAKSLAMSPRERSYVLAKIADLPDIDVAHDDEQDFCA